MNNPWLKEALRKLTNGNNLKNMKVICSQSLKKSISKMFRWSGYSQLCLHETLDVRCLDVTLPYQRR